MRYQNKAQLIQSLVTPEDVILDVGFSGQGVRYGDVAWPHALLKAHAKEVYGLDVQLNPAFVADPHYVQASAEDFSLPMRFDAIFAGDLIEHLSNPGLFLTSCKRHLKPGGRLILTTPNTFNLFNLAEKLAKPEPTVNRDHTCYFNSKTMRTLLAKNGMKPLEMSYLYALDVQFTESLKKRFLNGIYFLLSRVTDKFLETLVVVAVSHENI